MRILYYDCFAGISGDMNLGALIDLGVAAEYLQTEIGKLNIDGFHLEVQPDMRRGISGTRATVIIHNQDNEKHRHLSHIEQIINSSSLSQKVKLLALKIFDLIATAEAKVHNISKEKVHFHEVGALDSIADIVGAAICIDYLKVDKILSSPIQVGGGTIKCAHGVMPVPAPATAEILTGIPIKSGLVQYEATTPTGAAILVASVDEFTESMDMKISKTGYGIGFRDDPLVANVLRVFLLEEKQNENPLIEDDAFVVECNIDDMNPEWFDLLFEKLFEAGANDVYLTPIIMKKSRPGHKLSVICPKEILPVIETILFNNSTTIGIRKYKVSRSILERTETQVETELGQVRVKQSFLNSKKIRIKPEFEDLKALAIKHALTLDEVEKIVIKAHEQESE